MPEVRRGLGLLEAIIYGVGLILGAGIYAILGEATGATGDSIVVSFLPAALIASLTGLSYAELASLFPEAEGDYIYVREALSRDIVSDVTALGRLSMGVISTAAVSLAFSGYYGLGCTIVSTGAKIPIAAEFTQTKQAGQETAMRVTRDALAVDTPIWMLGNSAYDILDWHDHLLAAGVVPIAPYNPRNTDDPLDIEYRTENRMTEHSEDVQLKQSLLNETYNNRTGVERINDAVKDCGLGHVRARGHVHARTEVFVALCLRLVAAITNYERGNGPGREKL